MLRLCIGLAICAALGGCATRLYVPSADADGKLRPVKVAEMAGDAAGVKFSYSGLGGSVSYEAQKVVHSEPTRAAGEVVTAAGRGLGNVIWNYFFGSSVLETARGATATALAQEETARHASEQATEQLGIDAGRDIGLAEIAAGGGVE